MMKLNQVQNPILNAMLDEKILMRTELDGPRGNWYCVDISLEELVENFSRNTCCFRRYL